MRLLERGGGQERQEPGARCRARREPIRSEQKPAPANHSAAEAGPGPMAARQKLGSGAVTMGCSGLPISLLLDSWACAKEDWAQSF